MKKVNEGILHTLAKIAEANDDSNIRFAAAVVYRNKIISVGYNRRKSHPFQAKFAKNPEAIFLHAEVHAIKDALRDISVEDLARCELYISRVKKPKAGDKHFVWGLAKPCCGCQRAIAEFGIKRTIYTCDETGNYEVL
jgi:tRNA(Arg) A34 adenosine deaminase TadA